MVYAALVQPLVMIDAPEAPEKLTLNTFPWRAPLRIGTVTVFGPDSPAAQVRVPEVLV